MSTATEIGFLTNGTPSKLMTDTDAIPLRDPYQWRGAWQAVMGYKTADKVAHPTGYYSATTNHNSATVFADDLSKGFWIGNNVEAQVILDARVIGPVCMLPPPPGLCGYRDNEIMMVTRFRHQSGLTYMEVLLAVSLIAVCLAPAMNTIASGLSGHSSILKANSAQFYVPQALERTAAESFSSLLSAALSKASSDGTFTDPPSYSSPATKSCPEPVNVYILRYNPTLANPFSATTNDMLYLRAQISGGPSQGTLAVQR